MPEMCESWDIFSVRLMYLCQCWNFIAGEQFIESCFLFPAQGHLRAQRRNSTARMPDILQSPSSRRE